MARPKQMMKNKSLVFLVGGVVLVVIAGGVIWWNMSRTQTTDSSSRQNDSGAIRAIEQSGSDDDSQIKLVDDYSDEYEAALSRIDKREPGEWSKALVNDIYLSLVYADKIGDFTQVYASLALLKEAQRDDVDINLYGVDETTRDTIMKRADAAYQKQIDSTEGEQ